MPITCDLAIDKALQVVRVRLTVKWFPHWQIRSMHRPELLSDVFVITWHPGLGTKIDKFLQVTKTIVSAFRFAMFAKPHRSGAKKWGPHGLIATGLR